MKYLQKKMIMLVLLCISIALFFMFSDPEQLPLVATLVPFILIFTALFVTIDISLEVFFALEKTKKRIISLVLSIMPVVLLLIQSITQLTIRDVILCTLITIIVVWYISRIPPKGV